METWILWTSIGIVVFIVFLIMLAYRPNRVRVLVIDQFRKLKEYGGTLKDGKVTFRHNEASKAGVAVEGNELLKKRKTFYVYLDIEGTLLPMSAQTYQDKELRALLDLSTAQEKFYEAEALRAIAEKINNTWWDKNKHLVLAFFIIIVAGLLYWLTLHYANKIEPVPQPMYDITNMCIQTLQNVSSTNSEQFQTVLNAYAQQTGQDINTLVPR